MSLRRQAKYHLFPGETDFTRATRISLVRVSGQISLRAAPCRAPRPYSKTFRLFSWLAQDQNRGSKIRFSGLFSFRRQAKVHLFPGKQISLACDNHRTPKGAKPRWTKKIRNLHQARKSPPGNRTIRQGMSPSQTVQKPGSGSKIFGTITSFPSSPR